MRGIRNIISIFSVLVLLIVSCSSGDSDTSQGSASSRKTPSSTKPAFIANDLEGNIHTLDQYAGKALILNFWGTWCPPCRRELPDLKKIYAEYAPRGLEIIGLAVNDHPDKVRSFARQLGLDWVMLIANRESVAAYRIGTGVPVSIFIDRNGNEVTRAIGARDYNYFKTQIEKII